MHYDLVIKGGRVVTADSDTIADVAVKGEQIAAIGADLAAERTIDARGKLVTPGAVDVHVHLEMPIGAFTTSDSFFTGTRAAAYGGTTSVIDFVEAKPQQRLPEVLAERRALADAGAVVDYGLHMTIGPDDMDKLAQLQEVYDAGCVSFKLYMAYGLRLRDDQLFRALRAIHKVNGWPVIHAENWDVIQALIRSNLELGHIEPCWHPRSRPALMEGEATGRAIDIATLAQTRIHIFHVSCDDAVQRIAAARRRGLPVTAETCPQYLLNTQDAYDRPGVEGALPVCSPPIRDAQSQDALWLALSRGDLQVVSTDHCPFTRAEKESGLQAFNRIPGGVPSIEIRFPALYSEGVRKGRISLRQWVDACCTSPARLAGLQRKGEIAVGYDADLVIFDTEKVVQVSDSVLHENVDWTLYEDKAITGWPSVTLSRGEVIVEDGAFRGEAGRGRYAPRGYDS
jgi:dihydropyrimidinase